MPKGDTFAYYVRLEDPCKYRHQIVPVELLFLATLKATRFKAGKSGFLGRAATDETPRGIVPNMKFKPSRENGAGPCSPDIGIEGHVVS
jgi:hypothetical protein